MAVDRLTHRAKKALVDLPRRKSVLGVTVMKHLEKVGGMGSSLIKTFPRLRYSRKEKISLDKLVKEAYFQSIKLAHPYVGTEHLLLALLKISNSSDFDKVKRELVKLAVFPLSDASVSPGEYPLLEMFSRDLSVDALSIQERPLIYRDVYEAFLESLLLKTTSNTLIIGESGVGKDTLINLLVRDIAFLEIPPSLAGYRVIEFDIVTFLTGIFNKAGGFETNLSQLVTEIKKLNRVILYIKNFQNLFSSSSAGTAIPIFYSLLLNLLENGGVRIVATLNSEIYDKIYSENSSFFEKFTVIEVEEPDEEMSKKVLKTLSDNISSSYNISISDKVLSYIFTKASEYPSNAKMPKRVILFLDHCCAHVLLSKGRIPDSYKNMVDSSIETSLELESLIGSGKYDKAIEKSNTLTLLDKNLTLQENDIFGTSHKIVLTTTDVDEVITYYTSKNQAEVAFDIQALSTLSTRVKKRLIGQESAVEKVTKSLIRSCMGIRYKNRPLGNFLLLGPTGVGKTELAKVIAEEFFGEKSLIRLDMSDFGEKHTVSRLVGSPPGYVGYGEGGELTTKIANKQDSLVLFDEIEKAHPDVLNILLQIMEEGELSDARGQTFDFSKSIVMLTSNLGTEILHNSGIGFEDNDVPDSEVGSRLQQNVRKIIKPELINRFDEIITFSRLDKDSQMEILDLLIKEVTENLKGQQISIVVRKSVKDVLIRKGYSKEYGARALRRILERELLDSIAEYLLKETKRPLKLAVSLVDNKLKVKEVTRRKAGGKKKKDK